MESEKLVERGELSYEPCKKNRWIVKLTGKNNKGETIDVIPTWALSKLEWPDGKDNSFIKITCILYCESKPDEDLVINLDKLKNEYTEDNVSELWFLYPTGEIAKKVKLPVEYSHYKYSDLSMDDDGVATLTIFLREE